MSQLLLPHGLWIDGELHRDADVRDLTGDDERYLRESRTRAPPAELVTGLLSRCVTSVGPRAATPALVRSLTVGDREALLLQLRRRTLGDRMVCVFTCPVPACGKKMDVVLQAPDLLVPPYAHVAPEHELELPGEPARRVRFRLVTGEDQEAVARIARRDQAAALRELLRRCVIEGPEEWRTEELARLSARLYELDTQAEISLLLTCPECTHAFEALLDTAPYFMSEVGGSALDLHREVHLLALHYHWSARDILALTRRDRRIYLELLADAFGEEEEL